MIKDTRLSLVNCVYDTRTYDKEPLAIIMQHLRDACIRTLKDAEYTELKDLIYLKSQRAIRPYDDIIERVKGDTQITEDTVYDMSLYNRAKDEIDKKYNALINEVNTILSLWSESSWEYLSKKSNIHEASYILFNVFNRLNKIFIIDMKEYYQC